MKKRLRKMLSLALGVLLSMSITGCVITEEMIGKVEKLNSSSRAGLLSTSGSSDYGDKFGAANAYEEEKYVGIFYCLWLGVDAPGVMNGKKNVSDVYYGADARENYRDYVLSGSGTQYRYWGEPMYGYYESTDEWVIRKHLQLLTLAGIDFLAMDTTNAATYDAAVTVMLNCIAEYRAAGIPVPQVLFLTNTRSAETAVHLYNTFYTQEKYDDCWFRGNGSKPWLAAKPDGTAQQNQLLENKFYVKQMQWPTENPIENGFPWIDWAYPQTAFYDNQLGGNIYAVSIAQHAGLRRDIQFSDSVYARLLQLDGLNTLNDRGETTDQVYNYNHGRGYDFRTGKNAYDDEDKIVQNYNFKQQWETPMSDDESKMVMILGWNEWIAGNWPKSQMNNHYDDLNASMCDLVNLEFSRDIEMMAESEYGYADNCYLQMCKYIREFKGVGSGKAFADTETRSITSDRIVESEWENAVEYISFANSCKNRNTKDAFNQTVKNTTGRHDIMSVKLAKDEENLYFLITANGAISDRTSADNHWMNLYLGLSGTEGGWNDLQYVINRTSADGNASLHTIDADKGFTEISGAGCTYVLDGAKMLVKVPKSALGISSDDFTLYFKIADNNRKDLDLTDLYTNGDVAPLGRVNYVYTAK